MKQTFIIVSLAAATQAAFWDTAMDGVGKVFQGFNEASYPELDSTEIMSTSCYTSTEEAVAMFAEIGALSNPFSNYEKLMEAGILLTVVNEDCNYNGLLKYLNKRADVKNQLSSLVGSCTDLVVEGAMLGVWISTGNTTKRNENVFYDVYVAFSADSISTKSVSKALLGVMNRFLDFSADIIENELGTF
jgi:hypothetical protein